LFYKLIYGSDKTNSRIIVLGGETDSGKTYQSLIYGETDDRMRVLDTENRIQQTIDFHGIDRDIEVVPILQTYSKTDRSKDQIRFQPDYLSSYDTLRNEIEKAVDNCNDYDILVIDGVSPIRNQYCKAKWFRDNTGRKGIMPTEWGDINEDQRQLLESLIHMSRLENKTVIFTAQMTDMYRKDVLVGRQLDMRDWGNYNVDYIIELYRPTDDNNRPIHNKYMANCTKSIIGAWEEDISNGRNLYDVFLELGI